MGRFLGRRQPRAEDRTMADYILIDQYLGQLSKEIRWLRDAEEIAEEVADHLLESVEQRIDRGIDRLTAQRRALAEFGNPDVVGRAFASSRTGGAAMPTQFTRRAGYALIASALLWIAGLAIQYAADVADQTQRTSQPCRHLDGWSPRRSGATRVRRTGPIHNGRPKPTSPHGGRIPSGYPFQPARTLEER